MTAPDSGLAVIDRLLTEACSGAGDALVLRSEAGATQLLEYAADRATGMRVARTTGVEAESSYGFAALHRLLLPFLPGIDRLPRPQRNALRTAFGMAGTAAPDLFLVGMAVLTLLSDTAATRPLLVLADDAQWLDQQTTAVLAFVARRLGICRIALVCAVREPTDRCGPLDGLPDLRLQDRLAAGVAREQYAMTVLELGLGHYESATTHALRIFQDDPPGVGTHILPELVEAAARSGRPELAKAALDRLAVRARGSEGLLARSRALLADPAHADVLYREAVARSTATEHRARAHLLYGEWLRRRRHKRDARTHLSTAREMFEELHDAAFARRACIELQATGERLDGYGADTGKLTPQEEQVARLVVEGSSNREVAMQLFISHNTVEYHLQKIFRKLAVRSRTQLARAMTPQVTS